MDQDQSQLTLDESVKQVMQTLPPVIRTYLAQGKYTPVAKSLMSKYGLRIDQAGILEREIMLLLMGIENPDEFTQALVEEAKLDQQTVNDIVQNINTQIFLPLREEEMKSTASAPAAVPRPMNVPLTAEFPQESVQTYAPPLQSPKYFHLENKIATPRPVQPLRQQLVQLPHPTMTTPRPIESEKLLEDHEEPHIEFSKAPTPPVPPRTIPPPANLPGAVTPRVIPAGARAEPSIPAPAPRAVTPSVPSAPAAAPVAPVKAYTSDPYREPIE